MTVAMGKTKQTKEKKFDRSIEISAPIVDPELVKKFHSPTRGLDLRHGGFKALLSDPNSQDSTDEVTILDEYHIPSYIGIACAVSGYTNYCSQARRARGANSNIETNNNDSLSSSNNIDSQRHKRPISPVLIKTEPHVNHITLDKSQIQSPDEELKELTEKLTASANENLRSHSPSIPPTEDDRHHGAYVGARYFPLSSPSNVVNKHIPLLGIDDEANQDKVVEDENKVEQKIASLYGEDFVTGWRESMSHKTKKEIQSNKEDEENGVDSSSKKKNMKKSKSPKDLVKLKPASPNDKVSKGVEKDKPKAPLGKAKNFFSKMFGGNKSPSPSSQDEITTQVKDSSQEKSPTKDKTNREVDTETGNQKANGSIVEESDKKTPEPSKLTLDNPQSMIETPSRESDNAQEDLVKEPIEPSETVLVEELNSKSPQTELVNSGSAVDQEQEQEPEPESEIKVTPTKDSSKPGSPTQANDGQYYMDLLNKEKSDIDLLVKGAESTLAEKEDQLDEETVGRLRSAIGKANLLVNKKCKQFEELCGANINKPDDEPFATLNEDLAGFWDMLSIQFVDVRKAFDTIYDSKEESDNGPQSLSSIIKEKTSQGGKPKLSAQRDQERREKLFEHINQMKLAKAAANGGDEANTISDLSATEDIATAAVAEAVTSAIDTVEGSNDSPVEISEQPQSLIGLQSDIDGSEKVDQAQANNEKRDTKEDCPTENLIDA